MLMLTLMLKPSTWIKMFQSDRNVFPKPQTAVVRLRKVEQPLSDDTDAPPTSGRSRRRRLMLE